MGSWSVDTMYEGFWSTDVNTKNFGKNRYHPPSLVSVRALPYCYLTFAFYPFPSPYPSNTAASFLISFGWPLPVPGGHQPMLPLSTMKLGPRSLTPRLSAVKPPMRTMFLTLVLRTNYCVTVRAWLLCLLVFVNTYSLILSMFYTKVVIPKAVPWLCSPRPRHFWHLGECTTTSKRISSNAMI